MVQLKRSRLWKEGVAGSVKHNNGQSSLVQSRGRSRVGPALTVHPLVGMSAGVPPSSVIKSVSVL